MARGSKKTVEALEQKFETSKKPVQQDFFDLLSSFYHKDEDLAFLISISKATLTDAQAGEDHTRFMTALRVYQAIEFWTRLGKLENLYNDVNTLIMTRIGEMWAELLATNDTDTQIDTLGEIFLVLQNFNEWTGGIKAEFNHFYSVLRDITGDRQVQDTFDNHNGRIGNIEFRLKDVPNVERQVQNTFDNHNGRIGNIEFRMRDVPNVDRQVQNTFDNHNGRIGNVEFRLLDVPNNERQVQNTFDNLYSILKDLTGERIVKNTFESHAGRLGTLESLLRDVSGDRSVKNNFENLFSILKDLSGERVVKNTLENHDSRITTAQATADDGVSRANAAQSTANDAHTAIGRPSGSSETVWSRITGVYSYATVVAGVVNQIETMLNGYSFGTNRVIKDDVDYVNGRVNAVNGRADDLYNILSGFVGGGSVMNEIQIIRNGLHDAGIPGF